MINSNTSDSRKEALQTFLEPYILKIVQETVNEELANATDDIKNKVREKINIKLTELVTKFSEDHGTYLMEVILK